MLTLDLSPLFRSTVGFDRIADLLEAAARIDNETLSYPPYNVEKTGENDYRITMAVAGFTEDELAVNLRGNTLVISGQKKEGDDRATYLHRGIAQRAFERRFQLADYVTVTGARLVDGLLSVDLVRELPEDMKPRRIAIATGPAGAAKDRPTLIEGTASEAA